MSATGLREKMDNWERLCDLAVEEKVSLEELILCAEEDGIDFE